MLKLLRKRKFAKKIFYFLAIVIVPSFVLWGSASVIKDRRSGGQSGHAGKIFGRRVSFDEYMGALQAWRNQIRIRFGSQASQVENLLDANQAVWDKLILLSEAKRMKIKISNSELTEYIASLPFLQRDGVFNSALYELFLKYSIGTPVRIFEEQIRESLKVQKIFDYVTDDVKVSNEETKDRYKQEREQVKIKYISILSKDLEDEIKLNEQETKNYYEENKENLRVPIQINLNYIGNDYSDEATDEQKKEIDEKISRVHQALSESNDLSTAQEKFDLEVQTTGFYTLGNIMPGIELSPQDAIGLFNLKQDQISNIIQTARGPYIFQLKEKRVDYLPSLGEVREKVERRLTANKSKELARNKMDDYSSKMKSEKGSNPNLNLKQLAQKLGLSVEQTDFFTRNSFPQELGPSKELNKAAFDLGEEEISQTIEFNQGYCVIERSEFQPIDEEEFQKEKEDFELALLEEKKNQVFEKYFTKLKAKANLEDYISLQQAQRTPIKPN